MENLSHLYSSFCHALSLSLAHSHGKATIQVKILLCLSGYEIIVAFRAGSKSLPGDCSYLWVSSLKLLPLEKVAEGKVRHGCAVELCLLCSLGTVAVTRGSVLTKWHRQEQSCGKVRKGLWDDNMMLLLAGDSWGLLFPHKGMCKEQGGDQLPPYRSHGPCTQGDFSLCAEKMSRDVST